MNRNLLFILVILFSNISFAEKRNDLEFKFFKDEKTLIKNPFELRDPFMRKILKRRGGKKTLSGNRTVFSNAVSIGTAIIDNIRVVGILLGEDRRAIAKVTDGSGTLGTETFLLKEGMSLGQNGAEIKAILPGGIVLVEKIRNVYDQDEYLETVIPLFEE